MNTISQSQQISETFENYRYKINEIKCMVGKFIRQTQD